MIVYSVIVSALLAITVIVARIALINLHSAYAELRGLLETVHAEMEDELNSVHGPIEGGERLAWEAGHRSALHRCQRAITAILDRAVMMGPG